MRILHTSDLHLGKKLFGRERLAAQRKQLEWLLHFAGSERIPLILIAGDVFDTANPSAEAENLFYDFVSEAGAKAEVVVVSGNHDDPERLAAAKELARRHSITLCCDFECPTKTKKTVTVGSGWTRLCFGDETVNLVLLPYPSDARTGEALIAGESFADRIAARLKKAANECFAESGSRIIMSHLFCVGGSKSGSERDIELGTARLVPVECFPQSDYIALGHIHKYMRLGDNICYSGAPMPFTFDEIGEKAISVYDTATKKAERIAVPQFDALVAAEAEGVAAATRFLDENEDKLCQVIVHLDAPMTPSEVRQLKSHPNLVRMIPMPKALNPSQATAGRTQKSTVEILKEFCASRNVEPEEELLALFLELVGEDTV